MKAFRFGLQKVMEWRELQARACEERVSGLQHRMTLLQRQEMEVAASYAAAETKLLASPLLRGAELEALMAFQRRSLRMQKALQEQQARLAGVIAEERKRLIEARRAHRVLEQLKEKRWKAWVYEKDRELENNASESFLANWTRAEAERAEAQVN